MKTFISLRFIKGILLGIIPKYKKDYDVWEWHYEADNYPKCFNIHIYILFVGIHISFYWGNDKIR